MIRATFPGCKLVPHPEGGCGGNFEVKVRSAPDAPLKLAWAGPQSNLSEWSGMKEETLAAIAAGINRAK